MRHRTTQVLLLGSAVVDAVFPVTVATLDVIHPGVDPMSTTLSKHALRPGFPWMSVAFLAHGIALACLAWGLRRLPPRPWAAPVALLLGGLASVLLAVFADDGPNVETTSGHLHEAFATVAFLGVTAGGVAAVLEQRRHPGWHGLHKVPALCAVALLGLLALFGLVLLVAQFVDGVHEVYGLSERLVIAAIGAWMVTTAVQGARVAARLAGSKRAPSSAPPADR